MRRFVAPVSFGLGDLVVSLPAVQAAVAEDARAGTETWLVARSGVQAALAERIAGLAGTVAEAELVLGPSDTLVDLRDHPLQRDHWWGSAEFTEAWGPMRINEIVSRIAGELGLPCDVSEPVPLTGEPRPDVADVVIMVTEADGSAKGWPTDRWAGLAAALAATGAPSAVLTRGNGDSEAVCGGLSEVGAATPGDVVDVLGSCRAVVGVDTGPTHVAAQQKTPTVTLCRPPAVYFRAWSHTALVTGTPCDEACGRVERAYAARQQREFRADRPPRSCPSGAPCMTSIEVDAVLWALEGIW